MEGFTFTQIPSIGGLIGLYAYKIILGALTLWLGFKLITWIEKQTKKIFIKKDIDESLSIFLATLITVLLKTMVAISAISILGFNTTSFIAVLGAMGLAVGLALQGTLGNFAGGALIIILRPFKIGDFVEAQGFSGVVKRIDIFNTILLTGDRKTVIIPNGPLSTESIINYSTEVIRRVDMSFGIGYDDDLKLAKKTLIKLVEADDRILKDREYTVVVSELAESSVNFTVRAFVKTEDYWGVYFDMQENVKLVFDENNISIPYPQQDLHVHGLERGQQAASSMQ